MISCFRREVDENRALKTAYRSLQMGPIGCTETSVRDYHHTLRNVPEQPSSLPSDARFQGHKSPEPPKP